MVDQRVGEMISCRQRRAEYRATGVPSTRGGNEVGLSGSFSEPERSVSPANGNMYQPLATKKLCKTRKIEMHHTTTPGTCQKYLLHQQVKVSCYTQY
jgi:hypothetical protein